MNYSTRSIAALLFASIAITSAPSRAQCVADLVTDGRVDGADLGVLLAYWGPTNGSAFSLASDLNQDGFVDGTDLGVLLAGWGACTNVAVPQWAILVDLMPDPTVVPDPTMRQRIIDSGWAWRVRDTRTQIEMLLVPPGIFQMGCSPSTSYSCSSWEGPVRMVTITNPFYLGRFEVTQSQWTTEMGSNPSLFQAPQFPGSDDRPVDAVSWNMAQGFLQRTSMRLPTEAEWEFAYRAGSTTAFHSFPGMPNGTNDDHAWVVDQIAWYHGNTWGTKPVGLKAANALGFHDMSGNAWEWVNDWFAMSYPPTPEINPRGPVSGVARVMRGGGPNTHIGWLRSSFRNDVAPGNSLSDYGFGFRVAKNP